MGSGYVFRPSAYMHGPFGGDGDSVIDARVWAAFSADVSMGVATLLSRGARPRSMGTRDGYDEWRWSARSWDFTRHLSRDHFCVGTVLVRPFLVVAGDFFGNLFLPGLKRHVAERASPRGLGTLRMACRWPSAAA